MSISILIPAKNEESMIEECLASARWADEVIVLDNGSTDDTKKIVKTHQWVKCFCAEGVLEKYDADYEWYKNPDTHRAGEKAGS